MVGLALLALTPIELFRPGRMPHALLGKFMKGLADEFRSGKPSVNPKRFPAALNDRSNSGELLDVGRVSPARAIRTKQSQKTRAQLLACPWKAFEEEVLRVRFEKLLDSVIKLLENLLEGTQLTDKTLRCQHERLDQRRIIRYVLGSLYLLKPLFDQRLTA